MAAQAKNPVKRPTKIEEMTKEQISQAIVKKRECNAKAQSIVECLLEKDIHEGYFLKCLADINQTHFEDVIEERSILHQCGYPICQNTLSEKDIPKQKYRISMKSNKVYDITMRKSFCSNICYKSAMHVKKQILTSPLWFREYEVIPKFHLLPLDSAGSMGQEIDLSLTEKIHLKPERLLFTSINDFANASLNEMDNYQDNNNDNKNKNIEIDNHNIELTTTRNENDDTKDNRSIEERNLITDITDNKFLTTTNTMNNQTKGESESQDKKELICQKKTTQNLLNIVGEVREKPVKPIDPILINLPQNLTKNEVNTSANTVEKKLSQKTQPSITAVIEVEKCLAEWFTVDTLLFLYGKEKVKELVNDKGEFIQEYLNNYSKHIAYSSNTYDQYQDLCRKLNLLELEDRRFDVQALPRETKPLPDYTILKEESKKLNLKVKAFFSGETDIPEVQNENTESPKDKENETQLPLIDKKAQNTLRRRIVCKHLNRVLPDLLQSLGLLTLNITSDIRLLVNTFKLQAKNIMFKPIEWNLIAIVFIKLLSARDSTLEYLLGQSMAYQHMQLLLLSYEQDGDYLDRLISWLTDIDRLLVTQ